MSLTTGDIRNMQVAFRELSAMFVDLNVTLVDTGAVVATKGHVGLRGNSGIMTTTRSSPLTGAADQDTQICLVDYDNWNAASPDRPVRKGDVIEHFGMRYAVDRVTVAAPGNVPMFYKIQLRG